MFNTLKRKYINLTTDTKFSEILRGSIWALSARVLATVFGFISSIIIARFYGAEATGIVAVINSYLILITIFTVLGTNTSILRLIPEHIVKFSATSAYKLYQKTQYMVIGISLCTGILSFFSANLVADKVFSKPHLSIYFALASGFVVFKSLALLNTQAVRGLKLIKMFALMQIFPQSFNLILLITLVIYWPSPNVPVYALLGCFTLTGIIGWFIVESTFRKLITKKDDSIHNLSCKTILSISLPMLMTATMSFIISETGVIMLGMFRTEAEVGYYAIAVKVAYLTSFALMAINSIAGPKFSELFHSNKIDELFHVAQKSAKLIFYTTTPLLVGFIILGKPLLSIIFGSEFGVAYLALAILVLGQFVSSISGSTGMFLNMTGNQIVYRNIMLIAAALNIILNLLLIPMMGFNGAAIAATVSLSFWNIASLIIIKVKFGKTTGFFPVPFLKESS